MRAICNSNTYLSLQNQSPSNSANCIPLLKLNSFHISSRHAECLRRERGISAGFSRLKNTLKYNKRMFSLVTTNNPYERPYQMQYYLVFVNLLLLHNIAFRGLRSHSAFAGSCFWVQCGVNIYFHIDRISTLVYSRQSPILYKGNHSPIGTYGMPTLKIRFRQKKILNGVFSVWTREDGVVFFSKSVRIRTQDDIWETRDSTGWLVLLEHCRLKWILYANVSYVKSF